MFFITPTITKSLRRSTFPVASSLLWRSCYSTMLASEQTSASPLADIDVYIFVFNYLFFSLIFSFSSLVYYKFNYQNPLKTKLLVIN